jgi:hypothetical protein
MPTFVRMARFFEEFRALVIDLQEYPDMIRH